MAMASKSEHVSSAAALSTAALSSVWNSTLDLGGDSSLNFNLGESTLEECGVASNADAIKALNLTTGEVLELPPSVHPSQTVQMVKVIIASMTDIPILHMEVAHKGVALQQGRNLFSYGVGPGSVLDIHHRLERVPGAAAPSAGVDSQFKTAGSVRARPGLIFDWQRRGEVVAHAAQRGQKGQSSARQDCRLFFLDSVTGEKTMLPRAISLGEKVQLVKDIIAGTMSLQSQCIQLIWNGCVLQDTRTLVSYGIQSGQCLHMKRRPGEARSTQGRNLRLTVCCVDDSLRPIFARLQLEANASDQIVQIKSQIAALTGIAPGEQRLSMAGRTLANNRYLSDYGISGDEVTLQLVFPFSPSEAANHLEKNSSLAQKGAGASIERAEFPVSVCEAGPAGRRYRCGLTADISIRRLKERLAAQTGRRAEDLLLMYRGRLLRDDLTANYYNLEGGATLHLAFAGGGQRTRLEAGMSSPAKAAALDVLAPRT